MQVRICFNEVPSVLTGSQRIQDSSHDAGNHAFARLTGSHVETLHASVGWEGLSRFNVTPVFVRATADQPCGHLLMRASVDLLPRKTVFESHLPANLSQGPITDQLDWILLSAFKPNHDLRSPDLLEFCNDYSWSFLLLLTLLAICLPILAKLASSGRNHRKSHHHRRSGLSLWTLARFLLCNYESARLSPPVLLALLTLTTINRIHVGMTMKTEPVARNPPDKLRSIQDVVDHGSRFAWLSHADYASYISRSHSALEAVRLVSQQNRGFEKETSFYDWRASTVERFTQHLYNQSQAAIISQVVAADTHHFLCIVSWIYQLNYGSTQEKVIQSPIEGPHHPMGLPLSSHFVHSNPAFPAVRLVIRRSMEAALVKGIRQRQQPKLTADRIPKDMWTDETKRQVDSCLATLHSEQHVTNVFVPEITSLRGTLVVTGILLMTGVRVLMVEMQVASWRRVAGQEKGRNGRRDSQVKPERTVARPSSVKRRSNAFLAPPVMVRRS